MNSDVPGDGGVADRSSIGARRSKNVLRMHRDSRINDPGTIVRMRNADFLDRPDARPAFTTTPCALKFVDYAESGEREIATGEKLVLYYARKMLNTND